MNIHQIIKDWLKSKGYDGLILQDAGCGCDLDNLMPCGEPSPRCEAGHKEAAPEGSDVDFLIYPGKPGSLAEYIRKEEKK